MVEFNYNLWGGSIMQNVIQEKTLLHSKKKMIIYIIVTFILISGFLFWYFYIRLDESNLKKLETKIQNNKEVNKYFKFPSFSREESEKVVSYKKYKSYPYNLLVSFTDEFKNLTDTEKQDVFLKLTEIIEEDGLIRCGHNKYCSINEITAFNNESIDIESYSLDLFDNELTHSYYDTEGKYQTEILSDSDVSERNTISTTASYEPDLEIVEKKGEISGEYITVTGAVKNNSENVYTFIEVKVTYTDDSGNILDTDTAFVNSSDALLPNERKSFEVMTQMVGEKYTKYKVEVVDYNIGY